jgi:twitching motility protein PilT
MELQIDDLLQDLVEGGGSDLHLAAGQAPYGRFSGHLRPMRKEVLDEEQCNRLIFAMLNNSQRKQLEQTWELDCSYGLKGVSRFRVNVYRQRGTYAACLRSLGSHIPALESLGMPPVVAEMGCKPRGLLLVTGPTGSGKTTTLAAILEHINQTRSEHIITIEDPIEFIYTSAQSLIHQREVNEDTRSFANALRAALREDPDVILVGELRDLETIQQAISAAETGHLVLGTLHTSSAAQTVDRMVDAFPASQQNQIRGQLSQSLLAVFSQTLCQRINPAPGQFRRVMAQEILINTTATSNLIREGKTAQLYAQMETGGSVGMQTLERALANLVEAGSVSQAEALSKTGKPDQLLRLLGQI